ncbi:MAG: cysteine desulfurase family protein (TIGR01976 family) [Gammaproteobacteria bacterium]|jgi:cysteine desulfurase family protein (TIGR01976 family)
MTFTNTECLRSRQDFPALAREAGADPVAFLDGPGGTQVPHTVLDAIRASYIDRNANFDGQFRTSQEVGATVAAARNAVADFLGATSGADISFGANMTTLNFSLSHALVRTMRAGDEIVITELDHEANRGPWLNLRERGVVVREVKLEPSGHLDLDDFAKQITDRTKIVAMGLASNSLGTVTSLDLVRKLCDEVGALLVVDAVHYAAHFPMDVKNLGVDFLLCSAYKFYGPHIGILCSRPGLLDSLTPDYLCTQKSTAPYRIETGTLNHAAIAGVEACIDYIATWGTGDSRRAQIMSAMSDLHHYETDLARYYYESVKCLPRVRVWGPGFDGSPRSPTVSLSIDEMRPETVAAQLGAQGLQVWHGHFYALKVLEVLGLVDKGGLVRVGISMYNTRSEIDRLLTALEAITKS